MIRNASFSYFGRIQFDCTESFVIYIIAITGEIKELNIIKTHCHHHETHL